MKTGIIIQARMSSSRLPGKIMLPLGDRSVLGHVIERSQKALPLVIVATSADPSDDETVKEAEKYGAAVYRGDLHDVLSRYVGAVREYALDAAVRITADCPCTDAEIISGVIKLLKESRADYASNAEKRTFPHGTDTEAFTAEALFRSDKEEKRIEIREHVTLHIRRSADYKKVDYMTSEPAPEIRATLDTHEDYTALLAIFDMLPSGFSWRDLAALYKKHPWLSRINDTVYQKNAFTNEAEEMKEAAKLLALHDMFRAENLIKSGAFR